MPEKTHEELLSGAADVFANHPGHKSVWATSDGNYWLENYKSLADDHARRNGGLQVVPITREEAGVAPKKVKLPETATAGNAKPKKETAPEGGKPKKEKTPKEPKAPKAPAAGGDGQPGAGPNGEPGTGNEGNEGNDSNTGKE